MGQDLTASSVIQIVIVLLISMSIHEAMHAYAGHALGDTTAQEEGRLSLNPLRHIDPFMTIILPTITLVLPPHFPIMAAKPVPFNPLRVKFGEYGSALIALAGPLSNFALAFLIALIFRGMPSDTFIGGLLLYGVQINIILFVFNLIPIPPLDGSRVLYAFAPESVQDFMLRLEPVGLFIIFALVLLDQGRFLSNIYNSVLSILP